MALKRLPLKQAFTLVEMLVVIAITAIILTLVIVPIVQGFNMTRQAQALADAQDKARTVVERVGREISNAASILDNADRAGEVAVLVPGRNGAVVAPVLLEYCKLDLAKPATGEPLRGPSGAYIDPDTGKEDPTLKAPKGQVVLPVTPGDTVVRFSIGLRDPLHPRGYVNPYDGLLMAKEGERDNLYVLYRFEVQPYLWDNTNQRFVVNTAFFEVDPSTIVPGDPLSGKPVMDDPYFLLPGFDRFGGTLGGAALAAKQGRVRNWMKAGRVMTEVSRFDMIQPVYDKQSRKVVYDGDTPRILPLIQFRPTGIGNEPLEAMAAVRLSGEGDSATAFAPDVFRSSKGGWSATVIRFWPVGWDRTNASANEYLVARRYPGGSGEWRHGIFTFDPDLDASELYDGLLLFDGTAYEWAVRNRLPYAFSRALNPAAMANSTYRNRLAAFSMNEKLGRVTASFPIEELGDVNQLPEPPGGNKPDVLTGPTLSPVQDPNPPGTLTDAIYSPSEPKYEINSSFNKVWSVRPELRGNIHRFIDLRVVAQPDDTPSPLDPNPLRGFARARIVPGSESVIGPDQNAGPNYGQLIRYSRTTRNPGPNQYKLNYVDLPEPTDYRLLGFSNSEVTAFEGLGGSYSAANFLSAFIQPRFKAGYLQLYSDPNLPLPNGNIRVSYRFQFTRDGDSLSADYDSRQAMSIKLTIRNYPQSSLPNPQGITVAASAAVRNVLR